MSRPPSSIQRRAKTSDEKSETSDTSSANTAASFRQATLQANKLPDPTLSRFRNSYLSTMMLSIILCAGLQTYSFKSITLAYVDPTSTLTPWAQAGSRRTLAVAISYLTHRSVSRALHEKTEEETTHIHVSDIHNSHTHAYTLCIRTFFIHVFTVLC